MSLHTYSQRDAHRFAADPLHGRASPMPRALFRHTFVASLILASVAGFAGCGKKKEVPRIAVFPVEGQLLANGKPLVNALITLHPKSASAGTSKAHAQTDKEGKFKVSTYDSGDGAVPGEYAVTLQHFSTVKTPEGTSLGPSDISGKYSSPKTTDWVIKVAQQPNILPPKTIAR